MAQNFGSGRCDIALFIDCWEPPQPDGLHVFERIERRIEGDYMIDDETMTKDEFHEKIRQWCLKKIEAEVKEVDDQYELLSLDVVFDANTQHFIDEVDVSEYLSHQGYEIG